MTESRTIEMLGHFIPTKQPEYTAWDDISGNVRIVSDDINLRLENAQYSLFMAVNSLSRLYPIVNEIFIDMPDMPRLVDVPLFNGDTIFEAIRSFTELTQPKCKIGFIDGERMHDSDITLHVGSQKESGKYDVSIGSDGWIAIISKGNSGTGFSSNVNPIGAYTAALIGGMEVFKHLILKKADIIQPEWTEYDIRHQIKFIEDTIFFSSLTYEVGYNEFDNPPLPDKVDLGELIVVGVGAGGGAALYTISSLNKKVIGNLILVDPDELKPGNMNRYVYSKKDDADKERKKIDVIYDFLIKNFEDLCIKRYPVSYQDFMRIENKEKMDVVISTVDTKDSKQAIQWDIPRVILDAAVVQSEFYIRRVDLGSSLCMVCLDKQTITKTPEELASEVIGIDGEEIVRLRSENAIIEAGHIKKMREMSVIHNFTLPTIGERFGDWWLDHCGEIAISKTYQRIPLPFATILPGVFIAGEIIKEKYFSRYVLDNHYFYNMMSLPLDGQTKYKPKQGCILCSKEPAIKMFKEKYS